MKTAVSFVLVALALVASRAFAEEEHPYAKSKVGDWVSYKTTTNAGGVEQSMEMKQTVTKKTEEEVTVEMVMKTQGFELPPQSMVIKLKEKYDPVKGNDQNAKVTELGKGEETLTVAGKSYKTKWVHAEVVSNANGQEMKMKTKTWLSPDVPLMGMVKMETEGAAIGKMTMELTGAGSK